MAFKNKLGFVLEHLELEGTCKDHQVQLACIFKRIWDQFSNYKTLIIFMNISKTSNNNKLIAAKQWLCTEMCFLFS